MNKHILVILFLIFGFLSDRRAPSDVINGTTKQEPRISYNNPSDIPNPYKGRTETSEPWQYELFEVFRGAQAVAFDDTLDYEQDYSCFITCEEEGSVNYLHKYKCKIVLPQAMGNEPWMKQINAYYQGIMPDLIEEGADIWDKSFEDKEIQWLGYSFEGAYKHGNIMNVVLCREFYGFRPSIGQKLLVDLFSASDGGKLCLDDLFCVSKDDYLPVLQSSLLNATARFSDGYDPTCDEQFKSRSQWGITRFFDEASVAVTSFGLVFIYPIGTVDSMGAGSVFLNVPYKDLHGILNPTYFTIELFDGESSDNVDVRNMQVRPFH